MMNDAKRSRGMETVMPDGPGDRVDVEGHAHAAHILIDRPR